MSQLSEALKSFDTGYLTKAKNELIHAIPGDATFTSHVGMILRALLSHELGQRAQAEQSVPVPQKLATGPTDEPPPHEWTEPAPAPEELAAAEAGPPSGWTDPAPPPPTPSTRATPPRPRPPDRPRDW